jgi:sarcosine oxidase subunit gamma
MTTTKLSPCHDALEHLKPSWGKLHDMPVVLNFGKPEVESERIRSLALCDISAVPRMGLKGAGAAAWLKAQGVSIPENIYEWLPAGNGGMIARTGGAEFFIESGLDGELTPRLLSKLDSKTPGVYRVIRQDAALVMIGQNSNLVLTETCGVDFSKPESRLVFSRVAGVSCSLLPFTVNGIPAFRIWFDNSYGRYMFETLLGIVRDLGGDVVGFEALFPGIKV